MESHARIARYLRQRGKSLEGFVIEQDGTPYNPDLTGPQRRRAKHKRGREHSHEAGQRCVQCRPYPAGTATLITESGPRDWVPGARKNGKTALRVRGLSQAPVAVPGTAQGDAARSRSAHLAHRILRQRQSQSRKGS